jgi:hypothetical protein
MEDLNLTQALNLTQHKKIKKQDCIEYSVLLTSFTLARRFTIMKDFHKEIRDYLYYNKIKLKHFALQLNVSTTHLSSILHAKVKMSKKLALVFEKETNGAVTVQDGMDHNSKVSVREKKCPHCGERI